jgi:hypothetical protein
VYHPIRLNAACAAADRVDQPQDTRPPHQQRVDDGKRQRRVDRDVRDETDDDQEVLRGPGVRVVDRQQRRQQRAAGERAETE